MKEKRRSLYTRLGIIILAALLLEVLSAVQYTYMHSLMDDELEKHVLSELSAKGSLLRQTLRSAEATLDEHLWDIRRTIHNPDSVMQATVRLLCANPNIVGACLVFTPDFYTNRDPLYEPYAYWQGDSIVFEDLCSSPGHDYTLHPAYKWVMQHKEAVWSDPYEYTTPEGPTSLTTYTQPIFDSRGEIIAICGLDVSLKWLGDTLNAYFPFPSSFDLFMTQTGNLIAGPEASHASPQRVRQVMDLINDSTTEHRATDDQRISAIDFSDTETKQEGYIYYMNMKNAPWWKIVFVCYDNEAFGRLKTMSIHFFLLMLLGWGLIALIVLRAVRNMQQLNRVKAEKKHIDNELRVAHDLQRQMLPSATASFTAGGTAVLSGSLMPAKAVGGDLFDYFLHDEKLIFCIGDVSGKGIPSAMLMAKTITLFRATAAHESDPARMTAAINAASCQNNESNMFVTLFIGVIDLPTGRFTYCNAGHDRPYVNGSELPVKAHIPVGAFEDFTYTSETTVLPAETLLFLYTDGLTEAKDTSHKQFNQQRVTEVVEQCQGLQPDEMLQRILSEVHAFVGSAQQSDDLTMLAIRYTKG